MLQTLTLAALGLIAAGVWADRRRLAAADAVRARDLARLTYRVGELGSAITAFRGRLDGLGAKVRDCPTLALAAEHRARDTAALASALSGLAARQQAEAETLSDRT